MDQFKIRIKGKWWTVRWSRSVRFRGEECWGLCEWEHRRIRLHKSLKLPKNRKRLEHVLAHEVMHATARPLDEEFVEQSAADIVKALNHPEVRGQRDEQAKRSARKATRAT